MKISIAICTYNGEKYLPEQLQSILNQTRPPDEIIVSDDNSRDSTVEIIESFAAQSPIPFHIHRNQTNLGSTKNFEKAIGKCGGDIIVLSDQDDVWDKDKLSIFEKTFAENPQAGLVFCDARLVDENLNPLGGTNWNLTNFDARKQTDFAAGASLDYLLKGAYVWGCMMAFRASYKSLIMPIPDDLPGIIHDSWIALLLSATSVLKSVPLSLVDYRQHSAQQLGHKTEPQSSFGENVRKRYDYEDEIIRLTALRERLLSERHLFNSVKALAVIDSRRRHFASRLKMQTSGRVKKLGLIAGEIFGMRYHQHTNGLRSILKDLFIASN